ncbi:hypothetical protein N7462_003364 [Penicillium macrosclerotiorum]|uniref:uncharacterized protein n=1 Tax=Penicillium macrosclerotiorum TaxID=303699 RepID=UPI002547B5E0|nr:uncharacterized protein N7462_003364 [Penicillium macrosclerotiorum]KAJ5688972.1 hypothetical protein N7462_003364 [Penicillium macrosclerotiorum]
MFSTFNTRDRLKKSMSTRSMRRTRRAPEPEPVNAELARAQATAAASRAMRSSGSSTESQPYDRLGGPAHFAIPGRRPHSSLQSTEDSLPVRTGSAMCPVTPCQSRERNETSIPHPLQDCVALPPINEFRALDGRDSSVPSSYRRLRKAKSMFSTRARPSHVTYGATSIPSREPFDPEHSPEFQLPRTLRPSISFIRSHRQTPRAIRHAKSQDAAIQLARNQFLDEAGGLGSQPRRSSFFSRRKREHRPFRKTFRTTSDTGLGLASLSEHDSAMRSRSRSRTISASIKNGLMRVFGLSRPPGPPSESPFETENIIAPEGSIANEELTSKKVEDSMDLQYVISSDQQNAQVSPSRHSLCTSNSRVTSWADSTIANTIMTRNIGHRQSLSLIDEHGDINKQLPRVPESDNARQQTPSCNQVTDALGKGVSGQGLDTWADSHDLYSALMRRIGRQTTNSSEEKVVFGTVPEHRVIPERTSSVYFHQSRRTIRHVPSQDSSTPRSFTTARVGDSLSPHKRNVYPLKYTPSKVAQYASAPDSKPPSNALDERTLRLGYVIGEDSDGDDTGSVVIARHEGSKCSTVSPSVYSRTTTGNTPTKSSDDSIPSLLGETGTATIFASHRTAYISPARANDSPRVESRGQPSADWQHWMSAQIERIEKVTPTREHVREDAQCHTDDDEIFMGILRRSPSVLSPNLTGLSVAPDSANYVDESLLAVEPQSSTQNNFSRPFSRSSSIRTTIILPTIDPETVTKNLPPLPDEDTTTAFAPDAPSISYPAQADQILSPMRMRSSNLHSVPDSPTPRRTGAERPQKRVWTQEQYRRYSSRRPIANVKSNSFRSMRSYRDMETFNNENSQQLNEHDAMMDEYHTLHGSHSTMSSKRMVEMFLDSRRRQIGREVSENTAAGEAFI